MGVVGTAPIHTFSFPRLPTRPEARTRNSRTIRPCVAEADQSARGLAQSKTWRTTSIAEQPPRVMDCGSPLPLSTLAKGEVNPPALSMNRVIFDTGPLVAWLGAESDAPDYGVRISRSGAACAK